MSHFGPTGTNFFFFNYGDHTTIPSQAPEPTIGDCLLNLSNNQIFEYIKIGETVEQIPSEGATGTFTTEIGGWTGPTDTLTYTNYTNLKSALPI